MVVDGTGKKPPYRADIAVQEGKIDHIGEVSESNADQVIDASNLFVCPGFIDITNHSDTHWTLFSWPGQESMLRQGITTIMGGSCGTSLAPLVRSDGIRSIQKWADISEININWLGMGEFLDELERHKLGVNFGTLVGHGTLRRDALPDEAKFSAPEEQDQMAFLLKRALKEGAFGLSFGLTFSHGHAAPQEELYVLARAVSEAGRLVTIHLRDEGKNLLPSINEALRIIRETGARVQVSHLKALGRESWEDSPKALELFRHAQKENLPVSATVFPYTKTGSLLYALLPDWARDGGKEAILNRIGHEDHKRSIIQSLENATLHYDNITIASAKNDKRIVGKSLAHIAEDWGIKIEEAFLQVLRLNDLAVTIFGATMREDNIEAIYKEPYAYFSTDGVGMAVEAADRGDLEHPRSFGGTARFLGEYVRERSILPWEQAIFKMTKAPADSLGLLQRGVLEKGAHADIVVFDPERIHDNADYENPFQYPTGIEYVLVNGVLGVEKATLTGKLSGKVLRAI